MTPPVYWLANKSESILIVFVKAVINFNLSVPPQINHFCSLLYMSTHVIRCKEACGANMQCWHRMKNSWRKWHFQGNANCPHEPTIAWLLCWLASRQNAIRTDVHDFREAKYHVCILMYLQGAQFLPRMSTHPSVMKIQTYSYGNEPQMTHQ